MSTINEKLGMKPRTRIRYATKSPGIVSGATCAKCGGRHVIQHDINGEPTRACGFCGHVWDAPDPETV